LCDASPMRRFMVFGAVLLAVGCTGKTPTGAKGSASSGTVLAKVDDVVITDADLKEVLARHASQPFVRPGPPPRS